MRKQFKPFPYQVFSITWLITHPSAGEFLDMGLGKTAIVLTALNDLKYNRFQVNKTLVIAPKKVAETTWTDEAAKWEHLAHYRVVKVLGTKRQRINALNTPADMYVINREMTAWLVDYYANDWPFDTLVIDESTSFKNHRAKRFKALTWVRDKINRVIDLTGTPTPQGLLDLWAQVYLLDKGQRLGKTFSAYRERFFQPDQRSRTQIFSYKPEDGAEEEIFRRISDICISMKSEDYLSLPDKQVIEVPVELDGKAREAYEALERDMLLQVDPETEITAVTRAALGNKLLQLCNGAVYTNEIGDDGKPVQRVIPIHDEKIAAFKEIVEQTNGHPLLVFYSYKHDIDRIKNALKGSGLRIRVYKDDKDKKAWDAHEIDILLAHPASCAYGLNLQEGGNYIVWFGLNWSLELFQQANKRLHRQGQTQKVFIYILAVRGGMDEDVIAALQAKDGQQERLFDSLKARIEKAHEQQKSIDNAVKQ
mgnify:CR=1 FL=1